MRITRKMVEDRIETVQYLATKAGIEYVNAHHKAPYEGMHLYAANGTYALVATLEGSTGVTELSDARGLREVSYVLQGMIISLKNR